MYLDRWAGEAVTINYQIINVTASNNDFASSQPRKGTITIAVGTSRQELNISTNNDYDLEVNDTFQVVFTSPQINASVTATGTIRNDDQSKLETRSVSYTVDTTPYNYELGPDYDRLVGSLPENAYLNSSDKTVTLTPIWGGSIFKYREKKVEGGLVKETEVTVYISWNVKQKVTIATNGLPFTTTINESERTLGNPSSLPDGVSITGTQITIDEDNSNRLNGDSVTFTYLGMSGITWEVTIMFRGLARSIRSNETGWKPSWERGNDENVEWKNTNNKKLVAPAKKRTGYRAVSQDVKARVLLKVDNIIASFSKEIILGLGRDGDSVDDIIGAGLTKAVQTSQHPDLILTQRTAQGDSGYSGVKRAVIIGINYALNSKLNTLSGCINDATAMRGMLIDTYAYKTENIKVLRDDLQVDNTLPTRANILQSIRDVVSASEDKDEIWLHFSGHGSYVVDEGNDEVDKRDEGIIPSDFNESTIPIILDDELKTLLNEVKGTVMITQDCCNSGTGWDLPYMYTRQSNGSYSRSVEGARFSQTTTKNIYMLSGSRDDQLAVETGDRLGAFTDVLMECLRRRNHTVSLFNLENDINELLKERNLEQRTVFTSANYTASLANITRSMIMSSSAPDYRKRSVENVPRKTFPEQRREQVVNSLRNMMFTLSNKHLK
jgi:hypothetical protein